MSVHRAGHQLELQTMIGMGKFVDYFRDRVLKWQSALGTLLALLLFVSFFLSYEWFRDCMSKFCLFSLITLWIFRMLHSCRWHGGRSQGVGRRLESMGFPGDDLLGIR